MFKTTHGLGMQFQCVHMKSRPFKPNFCFHLRLLLAYTYLYCTISVQALTPQLTPCPNKQTDDSPRPTLPADAKPVHRCRDYLFCAVHSVV